MSCRPQSISVALTGSSGIRVGIRFIEVAKSRGINIEGIIVSNAAFRVAELEEGIGPKELLGILNDYGKVYKEHELDSPLASSSNQPDAMIIIPASMKTIASIAYGIQENLVTRAALSILRLGRKLVVVPRETPLGPTELEALYMISLSGTLVVPMCMSFYIKPRSVDELVDFIVGKVFDVIGYKFDLYKRWK